MTKYNPTVHAVEQLRIRFGIAEEHAKAWFNDVMETALYVTTQTPSGRKVYKHSGKDVMLVLDAKSDVIVTILPKHGEGERNKPAVSKMQAFNNAIIEKAIATIKRELTKVGREFTSEIRKLKIEQAEIGVEIAQAQVNKARCRAPHTQALIQQRIKSMETYYNAVSTKITKLTEEYEKTTAEASEFLPTEVTV